MLPDHDAVVVDEAHELVSRVTQASTDELSGPMIERAARRVRAAARSAGGDADDPQRGRGPRRRRRRAARAARRAARRPPRRSSGEQLAEVLTSVREAARSCLSAIGSRPTRPAEGEADAVRQQAKAAADEVRKVAERMAAGREHDVLWVNEREPRPGRQRAAGGARSTCRWRCATSCSGGHRWC